MKTYNTWRIQVFENANGEVVARLQARMGWFWLYTSPNWQSLHMARELCQRLNEDDQEQRKNKRRRLLWVESLP